MNTALLAPAHWFRFNLQSLLAFVALLAFGLTALKLATHGWAIAITTLTAAIFLFAIVRWLHGRDATRAFWSGFALCGGAYTALIWILPSGQYPVSTGSPAFSPYGLPQQKWAVNDLATSECLDFLFRKFNPSVEQLFPNATSISVFDATSMYPLVNSVPMAYTAPPTYVAPQAYFASAFSSPPASGSVAPPAIDEEESKGATDGDLAPQPQAATSNPWPSTSNATPTPVVVYQPAPVPSYVPPISPMNVANAGTPKYDPSVLYTRLAYFPRIGHCLFALLIGWIGGCLATCYASPLRIVSASPPPEQT